MSYSLRDISTYARRFGLFLRRQDLINRQAIKDAAGENFPLGDLAVQTLYPERVYVEHEPESCRYILTYGIEHREGHGSPLEIVLDYDGTVTLELACEQRFEGYESVMSQGTNQIQERLLPGRDMEVALHELDRLAALVHS